MRTVEQASREFMAVANRLPILYSLADEWNTLLALLEDPEQDPEAIQAELERVAGDIKRKGHGVAVVIQTLENLAGMQKAEAQRMAAKAKANQAHADRLREYALNCMRALDIDRLETGQYTLAIRQNPPKVEVTDESKIPPEFWRHPEPPPPEVDKRLILDVFKKDGLLVPGVDVVRGQRLEVR